MQFTATNDPLLSRIRGEFLEMPGLRLTVAQARRLWNVDADTCEHILAALVHTRFLQHFRDGRYGRPSDHIEPVLPVRLLKVDLEPVHHRRAR